MQTEKKMKEVAKIKEEEEDERNFSPDDGHGPELNMKTLFDFFSMEGI